MASERDTGASRPPGQIPLREALDLIGSGKAQSAAVVDPGEGAPPARPPRSPAPGGYDLIGWKRIADHLDVDHRTARRYATAASGTSNPLAVVRHRCTGRVYARSAELDARLVRNLEPVGRSAGG